MATEMRNGKQRTELTDQNKEEEKHNQDAKHLFSHSSESAWDLYRGMTEGCRGSRRTCLHHEPAIRRHAGVVLQEFAVDTREWSQRLPLM